MCLQLTKQEEKISLDMNRLYTDTDTYHYE